MISGTVTQGRARAMALPVRRVEAGVVALVLAAAALVLTMFAPFVSPAGAWSAPRTVYIEQTGHTLDQVFLDVWRDNGKEATYGYPITAEITLEDGTIVQYFQYARFEYRAEADANGQHFQIGNIGEELRPISLQRTTMGWNATTSSTPSSAQEMLAINEAWLPVAKTSMLGDVRYIDATQHTVKGEFRAFWEDTGEIAFLGNPLTEEYTQGDTTYQVFERGQLASTAEGISLVPVGQLLADKYGLDQSPVAQGDVPSYSEELFIAPEPEPVAVGGASGTYVAGGGEVWININLSTQYMTVYQGNTVIMETYISSGRPGFDTPPGTFFISYKLPMQDMEGVLGGEYYNVPNVPSVMYFTDVGHAIHGAYWHNNFGSVMSHGCINLPVGLAAWLYDITPMGARVVIHY